MYLIAPTKDQDCTLHSGWLMKEGGGTSTYGAPATQPPRCRWLWLYAQLTRYPRVCTHNANRSRNDAFRLKTR